MLLVRACVTALLVMLGPSVWAQSSPTAVHVEQAWARASAGPARSGAAYATLVNTGTIADRLIKVEAHIAERAELHTHAMDGQVMRMRAIAAIEVNPGEPSVLKPGGLHIMLIGLKAPLKAGGSFTMVLTFERAGPVRVEVAIGAAGAMGPDGGQKGHRHQGHGS